MGLADAGDAPPRLGCCRAPWVTRSGESSEEHVEQGVEGAAWLYENQTPECVGCGGSLRSHRQDGACDWFGNGRRASRLEMATPNNNKNFPVLF